MKTKETDMKLRHYFLAILLSLSSLINAQLKFSSQELEQIQVKTTTENGIEHYFFELNGKKIGPSVSTTGYVIASFRNKKGQIENAHIKLKAEDIKIDLYKKGELDGKGFHFEIDQLIYARDVDKEYISDYYATPFQEQQVTGRGCMGRCTDGFGFTNYKEDGIQVMGFFKNSYPEGPVYTEASHQNYYGNFKKGYREGFGMVMIKKNQRKDIFISSFKKGTPVGLSFFFNLSNNKIAANYRDKNGIVVKEFEVQ